MKSLFQLLSKTNTHKSARDLSSPINFFRNRLAQKTFSKGNLSLCTVLLTTSIGLLSEFTFLPQKSLAAPSACVGTFSTNAGGLVGYLNTITNSYTTILNYSATSTNLNAIAVQPSTGNIYFVDRTNNRLLYYNTATNATSLPLPLPTDPTLPLSSQIVGATFNNAGNLYIFYGSTKRLIEVNPLTGALIGSILTVTGGADLPAGTVNGDLAVSPSGQLFMVLDPLAGVDPKIFPLTVTGASAVVGTGISITGLGTTAANGLAISPLNGAVYVSTGQGTYSVDTSVFPHSATQLSTNLATDLGACGTPTPDPPTISKAFSPTSVAGLPATTTLTINVGNSNLVPIFLNAVLTDTLPASVVVRTPNNLGGTCTTVPGNTVTATAGSGSISLNSGAKIPVGGCTIIVDVTTATAGSYLNNIAVGSLRTISGNDTTGASATFTAVAAVTLSGTVFNDINGSQLQNVPETGTNAGGLNAVLVNSSNQVVASTAVAANGTYTFSSVPTNATYTVLITTATATVGAAPPAVTLPTNWVSTGENLNNAIDGTVDSILSVPVTTTNVTGVNLGIEQLPTAVGGTAASQVNPNGTNTVPVASTLFTGSTDPDGGTVASYRITAFPSNATSITINGTNYTSGTFPVGGVTITTAQLAGMVVDPIDGAVTVGILFRAIDNAGQLSSNTATVNLPFTAAAVQTPLVCDGRFYQVRATANNSNLYLINRFSNPYSDILQSSTANGTVLNGLAYNPIDNYMYALYRGPDSATTSGVTSTNALYRLDGSTIVSLGGITGLPVGFAPTAADFGPDGSYYVTRANGSTELYRINVATQTATLITLSGSGTPTGNIGDMAYNPIDGQLYGVGGAANNTLFRINPVTGNVTATTISGAAGQSWGTAYFNPIGTFYGYSNTGNFYRIDTVTGAATLLSTAPSASVSDGAACQYTSEKIDTVKSAGTVTRVNATTFDVPYTVQVRNTGTFNAPNVQITENLNLTFSLGSPTISIQVAPAVTSGALTINPSFNGTSNFNLLSGLNSLAGGAAATITFTVRLVYPNAAAVPSTVLNNQVYASTITSTTAPGTPNPGFTFPGNIPIPPPDLLTADTSTNGNTLPATANGDIPSPTPVTLPSASNPNLLLVKRLTAINGVPITGFNNDGIPASADDNANWPAPATYLQGDVTRNGVRPSDRLEYTIYFLSAGDTDITNVTICDLVPPQTTFVNNAYDVVGGGSGLGIGFANSTTTLPTAPTSYLTSILDGDRGRFLAPGITPPATCRNPANGLPLTAADNTDGIVVVDVVRRTTAIIPVPDAEKIPFATASGVPIASYGFVRFQVTVK